MNILIIVKTLSEKDGQGRYSLDLISELAKNHKITVLSPDNHNNDLLNQLGVLMVSIPNLLNIKKGLGGVLKYFFVFRKYLKQNDMVHFFTDLPGYMLFSPLMLFSNKPYFVTAHGTYIPTSLDHRYYRYLVGRFLRKAKGIVCVSNFTKNEINMLTAVATQAAMVIENTELMVKSKIIEEELEIRKLVEKAKGILMKEQNLSEEEAYRIIQKYSMNSRKSMRQVAEAIILAQTIKEKN